jgi:prepilin-type N-terminal cleavage/methylation domain-containing protein
MHRRCGFTLLEVMIATIIAGVIMVMLTQALQFTARMQWRANVISRAHERMWLLFNQFERDISTAYMGPFKQDNQSAKKEAVPSAQKDEKEREPQEKKQENIVVFTAQSHEGSALRIGKLSYELFKKLNFICTSPLMFPQQEEPRLVRVEYELFDDKQEVRSADKKVYKLVRKETFDIRNTEMKEPKDGILKKGQEVRSVVVADAIKELFVTYYFERPDDDEKKQASRRFFGEEEELRWFSTVDKKEKPKSLPRRVEIRVSFWDEAVEQATTFEATVPIIVYDLLTTDTKESVARRSAASASSAEPSQRPAQPGASPPPERGRNASP